jgi:hypothetical protein
LKSSQLSSAIRVCIRPCPNDDRPQVPGHSIESYAIWSLVTPSAKSMVAKFDRRSALLVSEQTGFVAKQR